MSKRNITCFKCNKIGHYANQCRSTSNSQRTCSTKTGNRNTCNQVALNFSSTLPGFVDSHCHIEYLYEKYKTSSYGVIYKKIKAFAPSFEACISNFCDPVKF